jgi:hypothetical protein
MIKHINIRIYSHSRDKESLNIYNLLKRLNVPMRIEDTHCEICDDYDSYAVVNPMDITNALKRRHS